MAKSQHGTYTQRMSPKFLRLRRRRFMGAAAPWTWERRGGNGDGGNNGGVATATVATAAAMTATVATAAAMTAVVAVSMGGASPAHCESKHVSAYTCAPMASMHTCGRAGGGMGRDEAVGWDAVRCGVIRCGVVWCGTVRYGTVRRGVVRGGTV